jgi:hypothetical protein
MTNDEFHEQPEVKSVQFNGPIDVGRPLQPTGGLVAGAHTPDKSPGGGDPSGPSPDSALPKPTKKRRRTSMTVLVTAIPAETHPEFQKDRGHGFAGLSTADRVAEIDDFCGRLINEAARREPRKGDVPLHSKAA